MVPPTSTEIRKWSRVDFDDRGFVIDTVPNPDVDALDRVIDIQTAWLEDNTGQTLSTIDTTTMPVPRATTRLSLKIQQAIMMLVEHQTAVASSDISETAADINMIASFSAGSYNESRRNYRMQYVLHPWRDLDDLLVDLLTDAARAALSGDVPIVGVTKPDWDTARYIIDANKKFLGPFGPRVP